MRTFIFLFSLLSIFSTSYAGEVTGAGLARILNQNNMSIQDLQRQGHQFLLGTKKINQAAKIELSKIRFVVGDDKVFDTQKINRIEFFENTGNQFDWKNVKGLEIDRRYLEQTEVDALILMPQQNP